MLRIVPPHDLRGMLLSYGMTLSDLSERTGIPEEELDGFAEGRIGLNARDRFAILEELAEASPVRHPVPIDTVPHQGAPVTHQDALKAYRFLMREVTVEELTEELAEMEEDLFKSDAKGFAQRARALHEEEPKAH